MKPVLDWFDHRIGYQWLMQEMLHERVPGGARWRYVWGSTLAFAFVIQVITGLALWASYSPSSTTAWESVYYIQYEMTWGWLLRGIHHFMAQAMIILLAMHLIQVVVDGAYRAPREVNFWLGLILMQIVLGLSLTGYLLPWDQKGYWATKVATNIAGITPVFGTQIQQIVVGGTDYGHHTLTRFFMLHAGLLPTLLTVFLALHLAIFRRHGLHAPNPLYSPDTTFWPDQVLRDTVACLVVMLAVIGVTIFLRGPGPAGGAPLGAPADPADQYSAARPEWYFLFLFEILKYFPGESEVIGAMILPGLVMLILFLMPIIGRSTMGHRANIMFLFGLFAAVGYLTFSAFRADGDVPAFLPRFIARPSDPKAIEALEQYQSAVKEAEQNAHRVKELIAEKSIGVEGARQLLRDDFATQGPRIFAAKCAACHRFNGSDGRGRPLAEAATASDLAGFGSREWIMGLVSNAGDKKYLGSAKNLAAGDMIDWSKKVGSKLSPDELAEIAEFMMVVAGRKEIDQKKAKAGRDLFLEGFKKMPEATTCGSCHILELDAETTEKTSGGGNGPTLTGYATRDWLSKFIDHPEEFYPDTNAMPSFVGKLTAREKEMLLDWLAK